MFMSKNGNNNGRGGNGAGGGQRRVSQPPTDINDKRKIAALEQEVARLTTMLRNKNSSEGPMRRGSRPPTGYAAMGSCTEDSAIDSSLMGSANLPDFREKSRVKKGLDKFHSAITASPVRSTVSPVTWLITAPLRYWRGILRIAAGGAAINGGASAYQQSPNLSLGNVGSAFMSNLRDIYNFAAEKIGGVVSMDLLAGFGTAVSYACAGACVLSAAFNRKSLKKIANRLSTSALFIGLPNIVSDVNSFMNSPEKFTTEGAINCFGTGSTLAIAAFASIRLISYALPDGIPLAGRIKSFVKNRRGEQEAPAQKARTAPKAQKEPGKIASAVYGVAGMASAAVSNLAGRIANPFKPKIGSYVKKARDAWRKGDTVPKETEVKIIDFLASIASSQDSPAPEEWIPVLLKVLNSKKDSEAAEEQAYRIISDNEVIRAMDMLSASLAEMLYDATYGEGIPQEQLSGIDVDFMREVYQVFEAYDRALGGGILSNIDGIPIYLGEIEKNQQRI
jgi:hypothetical protein